MSNKCLVMHARNMKELIDFISICRYGGWEVESGISKEKLAQMGPLCDDEARKSIYYYQTFPGAKEMFHEIHNPKFLELIKIVVGEKGEVIILRKMYSGRAPPIVTVQAKH